MHCADTPDTSQPAVGYNEGSGCKRNCKRQISNNNSNSTVT